MSQTSPLALLSVTDKTGVVDFAKNLSQLGFTLLSTGGTAQVLREAGLEVFDAAEYAGSPEIMDGRVKTLHPKIHGGILMDRNNQRHVQEADDHKILPIDLVVVNLYQFAEKAVDQNLTLADAINFIDIGGPTMLRAAAKNYLHVTPVIDPQDYDPVISELKAGGLQNQTRISLAHKVFSHISSYDRMIASYYEGALKESTAEDLPATIDLKLQRHSLLRYGENPHQSAAFYTFGQAGDGLQNAKVLQGKELSFNNLVDVDAAVAMVADLQDYTAVTVIKHTNPCGAAASRSLSVKEVFQKAFDADSKSAFGGIVACNREIDGATAEVMSGIFLECIAAPSFSSAAKEIFARKKNLRLLEVPLLKRHTQDKALQIKSVQGGILVQDLDQVLPSNRDAWTTVSKTSAEGQGDDLAFAMTICKHVKSNAIVYVKDLTTVAVGAGQMSRIDAAQFAAQKAQEEGRTLQGSVLASDAFFPFRDTVDFAASQGVKAIIQPGGSKRDQESIDACDEHDIAMVFTGKRHFKH
ncbi:bifunctional phosphoribosylaminoimidazolecarboxamide formyltransferase/IMP cyclohydrolase [Pseudobacteriovorax antillogorgiicola]|uniref:Bifunctional purine biosynthesis protein PurH n=1 Tax=Pseudobacteriovorax antillogorgiicola TaxID=1513793 RepID=A0A1Y6B9G7_9BACT|nr:bifunctional phosphoribosylaminoimidazolecarboxamide formyltransferase/IMP cyclohydrolase [Pseudobacteriovorax antillogorgiicola]TCS58668.1 IMP cyclohydrolase /phosphoribosylaminoimidazolecarboxamide formyltransferase [Pseudobacteriovorax antillogorgiicola]SME96126.1 IMP cyclohydrolase /phosphoribosylaminoimidazolecarboxamide formyltransferase [Pseudobacteriovorax antillogorgiicola]